LEQVAQVPNIEESMSTVVEQSDNIENIHVEPTDVKVNTENEDGPSVTAALEAMLGGVSSPMESAAEEKSVGEQVVTVAEHHDTDMADGPTQAEQSVTETGDAPTEPIMFDVPDTAMLDANTEIEENQDPEWEVDSSPYESSSDSSDSDDSSSSEDSDGADAYKLLSPEEQARILMEGDGGSDDEGGASKGKGAGAQLRTKNEIPEEVIPKPDVTITPEMRIEELGNVESVVESIALIKAKTSGEYRVLESGSVLCLEDRSVIGVVAETLGRVQQPLYSVRFTNAGEIAEAGLAIGTKIFYSEQHSTYVFTQALKAFKGSDASNLHDEEVGDEEVEFSDDEAEAEHKKRLKQKKIERRGGRMQANGQPRDSHPLKQEQKPYDSAVGLSYDDGEDDGPYKPLARPAGFASNAGRAEAPQEGVGYNGRPNRGGRDSNGPPRESFGGGRGRGDRGDRGRGRGGDRGRGRGGFQDRRQEGHAQPPRSNGWTPPAQHSASAPNIQQATGFNFAQQQPQQPAAPQGYNVQQPQFPQSFPQFPQFPFNAPPQQQQQQQQQQQYNLQQFQQPYPQANQQAPPAWNMVPPPQLPGGSFINPAFFGQQQQQAGGVPQWTPPQPPPPPQQQQNPDVQDLLRHLTAPRGGHGGS
jgi:H/ACA ribonucleoprotein complex non-core subunit NAF1